MVITKKGSRNLVWEKERVPSRGPKPALSTGAIARTAIRIADAEGLEAVTMQRVARESDVTTMALYRYFPGKSDLVAVMIDAAGGSAPILTADSHSWKEQLLEWTCGCAEIYRRHRWFLEATTTRRAMMGPNELAWVEAALKLLAEAGLAPSECWYAFLAIIGHIRGYATFEGLKSAGGSSKRWIRELSVLLGSDGSRYAQLQAAVASGAFSEDPSGAFEFGLNCILDGIQVRQSDLRARSARTGAKKSHRTRSR